MKTLKELLEGANEYPADEMTKKELQIACDAADDILNMLEDGMYLQRWQISAIVKASEELSSVQQSMSADYDEYEEEDY